MLMLLSRLFTSIKNFFSNRFVVMLVCLLAANFVLLLIYDSGKPIIVFQPFLTSVKLKKFSGNVINHNSASSSPKMFCDRKISKLSQSCLCYVDIVNATNSSDYSFVSEFDSRTINVTKCAMTSFEVGRLGNIMGEYATLYGLSNINGRPAMMRPRMADILKRYFKVTLPTIPHKMVSEIKWTHFLLHDWMEESYQNIEGQFVQLEGYPNSFTFYHHLKDEIKREFTLHDEIKSKAQSILRNLRGNLTSVTFVGVHVRRGDYVKLMHKHYKGVMADTDFFIKATNYFRRHYKNPMFIVVSNGIEWCKQNIPNDKGDVYFVGNNNETDPIKDFALLINCNHTIFTVGTFGYWAAYLTGGKVVYLSDFTPPYSPWRTVVKDEATYLHEWIPIAANRVDRELTNLINFKRTLRNRNFGKPKPFTFLD